jgi:hypothetical protein
LASTCTGGRRSIFASPIAHPIGLDQRIAWPPDFAGEHHSIKVIEIISGK